MAEIAPPVPVTQTRPVVAGRSFTLAAADGYGLAANLFEADSTGSDAHGLRNAARAVVVIGPAMGVPQAFYAPFASHLASLGLDTFTFDYRGMGLSAPASMRGFRASITDWAQRDYEAVLLHAHARARGRPLFIVGHSLGGQLLGLLPSRHLVAGMLTIASGSGYWRQNTRQLRRSALFLWWVLAPLTVPLFGYFPGRRIGAVGDLPAGAIWQWRRWCLHPDYAAGAEPAGRAMYADVRARILGLAFSDDEMMTAAGIEALHAHYRNAPVELRTLGPDDNNGRRIGHFGFFRADSRRHLWRVATIWLDEQIAAVVGAAVTQRVSSHHPGKNEEIS